MVNASTQNRMAQNLEEVRRVLHQANDDSCILPSHFIEEYWDEIFETICLFFKVLLKLTRHVFTTRVKTKFYNTSLKLSFNICKKFLKHRKHFRFRPKKIYPSKLTIIINKCDKIFIMSMINYMRHSPHITMNRFKTSGSTMSTRRKRK